MDNADTSDTSRYPPGIPILKQIFVSYAGESITDEQIQRILEPVIREILEGRFDKWSRRSFIQMLKQKMKNGLSGGNDMDNQLLMKQQDRMPTKEEAGSSMIEHLVQQAIRGEREALVALCESIARNVMFRVMRFVRVKEDAEEISQEVLIRVCEKIQWLKEPKAFYGWLNSIILNETRRYTGNNAKFANVLSIDDYQETNIEIEEPDEEFLPEAYAIREEARREVMEIVDNLPERQRETVIQHYYQNLSVMEIARAMEVSHPTVSLLLKRARKTIKEEINKRAKHSSAMYSVAMMPIGSLLKHVFYEEAAQITSNLSIEWINQAATKSLSHSGSIANTTAGTAAATSKIISAGLIKGIAITLIAAAVVTGSLIAGGVFRTTGNKTEMPAIANVTGEIIFSGGDAWHEHVNPKQVSVWAKNELGEMAPLQWWITLQNSKDTIYSGAGDSVNEVLVQMYLSNEEGDYELNFLMEDSAYNTYTLIRNFTIQV